MYLCYNYIPLLQICESDNAPMGFLYDAMDHSKEKIKQNFGGEETRYLPFWDIIDNVWDNFLYSTIHSAAYYLNPSLFYSDGFYVDAEVTTGLLDCIARMAKDHYVIARQLEAYRTPAGCFAEPMAVDQRTSVPPGELILFFLLIFVTYFKFIKLCGAIDLL